MRQNKIELVAVFKKDTTLKKAEEILKKSNYSFHEGMDSSRGKIYFYSTGPKFILTFNTVDEREDFVKNHERLAEIYELYEPDWEIRKD